MNIFDKIGLKSGGRAIFLGGFVTIIIVIVLILTVPGERRPKEDEPETVLENFCRALGRGDFESAAGLCLGEEMSGYIEAYENALTSLYERDSTTTALAARFMGELSITPMDTKSERGRKIIYFQLEDSFGNIKEKTAVLKREEGEWKIEKLDDRS